ncbi:MAG: hypothetical protein VYA54_07890 [Bdellovibrionota bacterium]|nr:hypothetical protein [Bdellovibrionota bacterium]
MKRNFLLGAFAALMSYQVMASGHHDFNHYKFMDVKHVEKAQFPELGVDVYTRNFSSSSDIKKLNKGVEILKAVMNSSRFRELVYGFSFNGERRFNDNNGMSNEEIYAHLMTGAEVLMPEADHIMNFDLTLYRSWNPFSKVKGYTLPDTMRIWIHTKFYRKRSWTSKDVAANLAHEWVHKMGFGHDYNYNDDRPYSVPYGIGGIVSRVASELGY